MNEFKLQAKKSASYSVETLIKILKDTKDMTNEEIENYIETEVEAQISRNKGTDYEMTESQTLAFWERRVEQALKLREMSKAEFLEFKREKERNILINLDEEGDLIDEDQFSRLA